MANENFTNGYVVSDFEHLKKQGKLNYTCNSNNTNVTSVTVYSRYGWTKTFTCHWWTSEELEELANMVYHYWDRAIEWSTLSHYDTSMAQYSALDMTTDNIRKYVKESYQNSKKFIDLLKQKDGFAICSADFLKTYESFKPEKCNAKLLNGYYITPKIYEYLKEYAWE